MVCIQYLSEITFTCAFAYLHGFQQLHSLNNVSDIGGFSTFTFKLAQIAILGKCCTIVNVRICFK